MAIINKSILSVKKLLNKEIIIPPYQRPYKWQAAHINRLIDDLLFHQEKNLYRLGTIVFHKERSIASLNIVDGQQRLITLTIICTLLSNSNLYSPKLLDQEFTSNITQENIQHNAALILQRINQMSEDDRETLLNFILHKCQLITVTIDTLNEAFQFFDSQNSRGKELAPYDLLKAFHLREMVNNTEQQRMISVAKWESEISQDHNQRYSSSNLHIVMNDYLFRLRRWSQGQSGQWFNKQSIGVFKGVSSNNNFPFTAPVRAIDAHTEQQNFDFTNQLTHIKTNYPFQVDQTMLNGIRFFEYIQHYIDVYRHLFIEKKSELSELMEIINNYDGRNRQGDYYVRTLFFCAVLFYFDRFGNAELEKAATLCFAWSYRLRLEQNRVAMESIDNLAKNNEELINFIKQSLCPQDVLSFPMRPILESNIKGTKIGYLIKKLKDLGYINEY